MKKLLLSAIGFALFSSAIAQNPIPESDAEKAFLQAYQLFQIDQYGASRARFESYLKGHPNHHRSAEAQYYIAYNAINEGQPDAESLMSSFIADNGSHPLAVAAYFDLGNQYFDQKEYSKAIKYFEKADFKALPSQKAYEGQFKLGYSYYSRGNDQQALNNFREVTRFDNSYYHAAFYYTGVIYYKESNYQEAINNLLKAEASEAYKDLTPEYVATAYLATGQYDALLEYIKRLGQIKLQRNMQLLTAEAHFHKEDYAKASELYQLALSSNRSKVDPLIYYHQGFSDYKIGQENQAIEAFKLAALSSDTIGQYGSYYLGVLYTRAGNKQFALNAFENAAKSAFNSAIKEESSFRTGQLHFELGQYANCIEKLNEFVSQYEASAFKPQANDLISEAYLRTSNYDLAIAHIEGLEKRSTAIDKVYQQVTLMKGHQLFNDSQFLRSITLYNKSLGSPIDPETVREANYWKGEAYSIGKKWVEAINAYSKVVFSSSSTRSPYFLQSRYGLGYAYYNTKVYDRAKIQFAEYTRALKGAYDQPGYLDALVRLADCYFVEKDYRSAISNYENALRGKSLDKAYIYFQLGLNYGFQGNTPQARRNFNIVINSYSNSPEAERSYYQKAQLDFEEGEFQGAIEGFTSLISKYDQSKLLPHALVKRAVAYSSLQNLQAARADYERILNNHITHPVANSALLGLQELSSQGMDLNLDQYISQYRAANPDDASVESIEFEAAKNRYFNQEYQVAIERFKSFNTAYPASALRGEALYFIADAYKRSGDNTQALQYFHQVKDFPDISYFNRSIRRIADIALENGNYEEAIKHYHWLHRIARNRKEVYNANEGLMLSYQNMSLPDSVTRYANKILGEDQLSPNGASTANLFLGKSAIAGGSYDSAKAYLQETINIADDENAAEATYLIGQINHLQGFYTESNEILFTMNSKYSSYERWLGQSFLLIADNYLELEELFQAEATLQSIIDNSPHEDIVEQAKDKLEELKSEEREIIEERLPQDADTTVQNEGNDK